MQPQAARVFDTLGKVLQGSSSASGHSIASFLPNCGTCCLYDATGLCCHVFEGALCTSLTTSAPSIHHLCLLRHDSCQQSLCTVMQPTLSTCTAIIWCHKCCTDRKNCMLAGQSAPAIPALKCLQAWLGHRLAGPNGHSACSPGAVQTHQASNDYLFSIPKLLFQFRNVIRTLKMKTQKRLGTVKTRIYRDALASFQACSLLHSGYHATASASACSVEI